jgi:hypothetical protein
VNVDTLPPGETGTELSAGDALDALHTALQAATSPASKYLSVRDVQFQKVGRWVLLSLVWKDGKTRHTLTVRMPTAKARSLAARLGAVVGE